MPETVARTRASATRKRQPGRNRKFRRFLVFFSLITLLLAGGVAGAVYWKIDSTLNKVTQPQNGYASSVSQNVDPIYRSDKPMSFVVLGSDTRPETGSMNTDVMIVAVANPDTKKVTMVSIPRDTRVKIPGYRNYHKINSVYANGEAERRQAERNNQTPTEDGISLTKKTLSEILGIPIEHYVAIDFDGFKAVIDELGGVEVNVDRKLVYDDPTDDTHINLSPGLQVLNGEQALGYVRHRQDNRGTKYYSSDFDRNRRQQEMIKAVVQKTASLEGLTKVFNIMDVGAKNIHTDLSKDQIKGLAYDFKGFSSSTVTALDNGAYWQGGYTYLEKEKLEEIRSSLQAEMGLSGNVVAQLNNSPVLGGSENAVAASSNSKPKKKKTTESAAPAPTETKPKAHVDEPKQEENPIESAEGQPHTDQGTTPPPDVVSPEQSGQSGQTSPTDPATPPTTVPPTPSGGETPPPDIVSPSGTEEGPVSTTNPTSSTS
jgi:LCP family protein required for cell wall assembly